MSAARTVWIAGTALISLLAAGCALGDEGSSPPSAVGTLVGTDAVVGASTAGGLVTFYVCGGAGSIDTATRWFVGAGDASGAFTLKRDGWTVTGDLGQGSGEVTSPEGETRAWNTHPATPSTLEGLYSTMDSGCRTGAVILQPDASAPPRLQGAWCDDGGQFAQVTPILPVALTEKGVGIRVLGTASKKDLFVEPVVLTK
jgi:hypothetical protein